MIQCIKASCVDKNLTPRGLSAPCPMATYMHTCKESLKLFMIKVESDLWKIICGKFIVTDQSIEQSCHDKKLTDICSIACFRCFMLNYLGLPYNFIRK